MSIKPMYIGMRKIGLYERRQTRRGIIPFRGADGSPPDVSSVDEMIRLNKKACTSERYAKAVADAFRSYYTKGGSQ